MHTAQIKAYENWPFSKKLFLKFRLWGQMIDNLVLNSEQFFFLLQISWIFQRYVFKFRKIKGGTLWWKKSEKNRFLCLIPQKNRLKKCRLAVKSVFWKYWFLGKLWTKKYWKKGILSKFGDFGNFSVCLVHNFPKNQYFQKPISLLIYIF